MKLQIFNGGLNNRLAPHLIHQAESVEYENVDSSTGTLSPVKTKSSSGIELDEYAHFFESNGTWVHSSAPRHYLEHQKNLYYTETGVIPKYFDGTTEYLLGIDKPTGALIATASFGIEKPTTKVTAAVGAAGVLTGTYKYVITYYNSSSSLESLASPTSSNITVASEKVDLSAIPVSTDNQVDQKRIYRIGETLTDLSLIATITNATTTYTDNIADSSATTQPSVLLTGTYTYVMTYYNSTKGVESQPTTVSNEIEAVNVDIDLTGLTVSTDSQVDQKRIYRVGGSLTSFTLVDTIANAITVYTDNTADTEIPGDDMVATDYRQAPSGLNYLTESNSVLFGALGDKLYYTDVGVYTSWPATYFIDMLTDITGIADSGVGVLVFTKYKTYIITGTSHTTFSKRLFDGNQGCLSFDSLQYVKGTLIWVSSDGLCTVNGSLVDVISKNKLGKINLTIINSAFHDDVYYALQSNSTIIAYDFRFGPIIKHLGTDVTRLVVGSDILYGYSAGTYYPLFAGLMSENFAYKSPNFAEGTLTVRKIYKSVYVKSQGAITVEVFISNVSVITAVFATDDSHELKIPEGSKNGYSIQFRVTGTGSVDEISYEVAA